MIRGHLEHRKQSHYGDMAIMSMCIQSLGLSSHKPWHKQVSLKRYVGPVGCIRNYLIQYYYFTLPSVSVSFPVTKLDFTVVPISFIYETSCPPPPQVEFPRRSNPSKFYSTTIDFRTSFDILRMQSSSIVVCTMLLWGSLPGAGCFFGQVYNFHTPFNIN